MPGNRVEQLEAKVSELESTVEGLTEELVETKERVRDLEAELEPEPADGSQFASESSAPEAPAEESFDEQVEADKQEATEGGDDTESVDDDAEEESTLGDDIIVA